MTSARRLSRTFFYPKRGYTDNELAECKRLEIAIEKIDATLSWISRIEPREREGLKKNTRKFGWMTEGILFGMVVPTLKATRSDLYDSLFQYREQLWHAVAVLYQPPPLIRHLRLDYNIVSR